jgi:hypothetical protein
LARRPDIEVTTAVIHTAIQEAREGKVAKTNTVFGSDSGKQSVKGARKGIFDRCVTLSVRAL